MKEGNFSQTQSFARVLLFTGHRIDSPGRREPRFPARAEFSARAAIYAAVLGLRRDATIGLAAGASGGDLLFHEVCAELDIPTRLYLALPAEEFVAASVAPAGPEWVRRFNTLVDRLGPANVLVMPGFDGPTGNIWRCLNQWMIEQATALAPERTLIALWDGKGGDGLGGTEDFVHTAQAFGIHVAPPIRMQTLME